MTTVAYAAVCRSGLSFERQLWMREEIVPELHRLTDGIHAEGAKASIQLGHCGNMSHKKICGCRPLGASSGFNLYSPTLVHGMTREEIDEVVNAYGHAVELAIQAGFDAVEIHAGHGYLISQFLSPYTNKRKDEFGGSLENRMRFMKMVMEKVVAAGKGKVAIFVKMNTRDGFRGGMEIDDCITVAKELQKAGADALVLSGGFVSRAPMYVMRGEFPVRPIIHYMPWRQWWLKLGVLLGGRLVSPTVTYKRLFFLEDAKKFRAALPDMPLVYVGGVNSRKDADEVMDEGKYDIVILDELTIAIHLKLLTTGEVLELLSHKRPETEIVITGRYAPQELIDAADLVTEMKEIKHYYTSGVLSRDGIDK